MNFRLYKFLSIDDSSIHSIGIFKIESSNNLNDRYMALHFKDCMKYVYDCIDCNDYVINPSDIHTIFEDYANSYPEEMFIEPEDALFNVFRKLYKKDIEKKGKRKHGS